MPKDFNVVADSIQVSLATEKEMEVYTLRYSVDQLAAMEALRMSISSVAY
jgi:hypothetical protein